jgi:propionyl-CoA carboxylase alpha chain
MFKRILIANRGEIACRIIRTARRLGIATVAVYSEADRDAPHTAMADEAIPIGPPPSESYLCIERLVAACKRACAEAVHPGYGFLSERADFARALEKAGIVFIGPNPVAIAAMGDKIAAKKTATRANVSTVPGHLGVVTDERQALKIAAQIGYPVMIKAAAGGGGKGMRIVHSKAEVAEGFARAGSEARSSFGDERVFIERFIERPRHIEIQVLGDKYGNVVHLGERECSIQRRNQKIVEEAPSPLIDGETRVRMGAQAIALAKAVDYDSAGTVEFVVTEDKSFYFLEMNTRLQVEHPVTELVTGIDLVEQMIRVAAGEKLAFAQDDVSIRGWAVETRIYAEDPYRNFLPSIGRLTRFRPPPTVPREGASSTARPDLTKLSGEQGDSGAASATSARPARLRASSTRYGEEVARASARAGEGGRAYREVRTPSPQPSPQRGEGVRRVRGAAMPYDRHSISVRIDTGVEEGSEISIYYDPLIAKLITHAPSRQEAVAAQADALDAFTIEGIRHNIPFLAALMGHPRWQAGKLSTGFIAEEYPGGFRPLPPTGDIAHVLAAVAAAIDHGMTGRRRRISGQHRSRPASRKRRRVVRLDDCELALDIEPSDDALAVQFVGYADGTRHSLVSRWKPGDPLWNGNFDGRAASVQVRPILNGFVLSHRGVETRAYVYTEDEAEIARLMPARASANGGKILRCPMPGLVISIAVVPGQEVKAGEALAVVEAMKMQNVLRAERDGVVKEIKAEPGDSLAVDDVILEFA